VGLKRPPFSTKRQRVGKVLLNEDGLSWNFVNSLLAQPIFYGLARMEGQSFDKVKKTWKTYSQKEGLTETEIKSL